MIELKPCPFCGSAADIIDNGNGLFCVGCTGDDMCFGSVQHVTMIFVSEETAAETWNRRATE